ncbi:MAG: ABC-F family ATP-binding cassette domain-containing protein [Candidatus Aminicenantes bacterium]|jgi:ATP-binding cassette subfamily F protein 3
MHQIKDLHYSIGEKNLLSGVSWVINPEQRVALIGPNGAGKTTLFRIITGEIEPLSGAILAPKGYRIGYLPQEETDVFGGFVLQTALEGHEEVANLEKRIEELHRSLGVSPSKHDKLLDQLGSLEQRYEALGGYRLEAEAKAILTGLGFSEKEFSCDLTQLSGGWRMRVYLARLLVQKPDMLLLDEPTNHLDLPALEWLEQYLLQFSGSVVVVSHDRFFIDRLVEGIYELDRGQLVRYPGNYHSYEKQKRQRDEMLRKKWEEQREERKRQERFIERFRYKASKAAQVQSRIKQLEKMERIELPALSRHLDFSITVETPSYKDVLTIDNLWFRYAENWVLQGLNLHVSRGDKLALVGANGAGKTTLTRLITGQMSPQKGTVNLGKRTCVGYYAQHQVMALDLESTVYDEVFKTAAESFIPRIRDVLGVFQLSGDEVFKKIKVLSGGEKARVSLAKILLSPVNFLIMDEPTNHLDMPSVEALESALGQYRGTLLMISHDRYFLDKLVSRVIELKDGGLEEYSGNYSYYLEKRSTASVDMKPSHEKTAPKPSSRKSKEQKRLEAAARQAVSKRRNQLQRDIESLELRINELEVAKKEVENRLTLPESYRDTASLISLQKQYASVKKDLEASYEVWERSKLELENLLSQLP